MVLKTRKRAATPSTSLPKKVDPSISAYTLEISRKRKALSRLPIDDNDEKEECDESEVEACTDKRRRLGDHEDAAEDVLKALVLKASQAAHCNPSDGRWATVRQILRLSCTQGRNYRWIAPQKQLEASASLDLRLWSEQVSELLRRRWKPRAGPEYEKELLRRVQKEWVPTEAYPTRETAVVKQILEKKEWVMDIMKFVQQWLTSSTRDGSTEIRDILAKKKLVDSLQVFLESLIMSDAPNAALAKDYHKEQWVMQVTQFIQRNGAPALIRNSSSNPSLTSTENKNFALQEKVKNWQQTLKDHPPLPSAAPSNSGSTKSKSKRTETVTTAPRKVAQSATKQTALGFSVSKSSASRLAGMSKPTVYARRNPPPVVDDDISSDESHHDAHIGLPSQPLSFRSSQIKHSTPKDGALAAVEGPAPSSSLSAPPLHTSPSRPPRITSVLGNEADPSFKRPQSPSSARMNTRPSKQARTDKNAKIHNDGPPMKDNSVKPSHSTRIPPSQSLPTSSPLSPPPATPDNGSGGKNEKKKNDVPTLMELLSARKATPLKKKKNKNTLTIISTPRPNRNEHQSFVAPAPIISRTSTASELALPSGDKGTASTRAFLSRHVNSQAKTRERVLSSNVAGPSNSKHEGQAAGVRIPPVVAIHETQTSTSVITSTYSVQHQPEFTASGYAIDLPLSVIDGFVGREGGSSGDDEIEFHGGSRERRKGKEVEGNPRNKGKKEKKKKGYFGMDDVDLTSPTKLRPGVVRPFADSSSEDEDGGGVERDTGSVDVHAGEEDAVVNDRSTPKNRLSAFDESQLPDFTNDFDAFDPPQVSTQPRRKSNNGSGNWHGEGRGEHDPDPSPGIIGFGAAPWANELNDDDNDDEEEQGEPDYAAPRSIFTKDGTINVSSLDDDPTVHSQAFFNISGLRSPTKKKSRNRIQSNIRQDKQKKDDPAVFGFGYSSQMDVEGEVEMVSRFMDKDVDLMDVEMDADGVRADEDDEDTENFRESNSHDDVGGSYFSHDQSRRVMWGGWS
ncbi:hypothetical protein F5050DRAFT_1803432 [Lentinula boryana]|uniref:Uncharacterized protein n=1 Tax=Lentinula boryana TaxID=40481 RepID=A0ABQ8QS22_9AGAR|nr:hypothetical protein F5050DRAFT_1803432 [Lentinula boryana]